VNGSICRPFSGRVVVDGAGAECSCRSLHARLGPDRVSKRRPIGVI
jgi:hypothetical protein